MYFEQAACTHCTATGCDFVDGAGNPWHARCFQAWRAEYTAYLDDIAGGPPEYLTPAQRRRRNSLVARALQRIADGLRDLFPTRPRRSRPRFMR